jgi:molecular chaperone Hsp33
VLAEQGSITVTCEFCRRPYRFDAVDAVSLFAEASIGEPPPSIN